MKKKKEEEEEYFQVMGWGSTLFQSLCTSTMALV